MLPSSQPFTLVVAAMVHARAIFTKCEPRCAGAVLVIGVVVAIVNAIQKHIPQKAVQITTSRFATSYILQGLVPGFTCRPVNVFLPARLRAKQWARC